MTQNDFLRLLAIGFIGLLMGLPFVLFALDAREMSANIADEQIAINPQSHQIVEVAISLLLWGGIVTIAVTNIPVIVVMCAVIVTAYRWIMEDNSD